MGRSLYAYNDTDTYLVILVVYSFLLVFSMGHGRPCITVSRTRTPTGTSREEVFQGFAGSDEWAGICAEYGILK